jgi:hypothetical protein
MAESHIDPRRAQRAGVFAPDRSGPTLLPLDKEKAAKAEVAFAAAALEAALTQPQVLAIVALMCSANAPEPAVKIGAELPKNTPMPDTKVSVLKQETERLLVCILQRRGIA